jgi:hypothetical protein
MWLSLPSEFNDPYEFKIDIDIKHYIKQVIRENKELKKHNDVLDELEYNLFKINCKAEEVRNQAIIGCFSEKCNSLLMWSHYASFHKGFCIEYNINDLIHKFNTLLLPVVYGKKYNMYYHNVNNKKDELYKIFITKAREWKYEKEWRYVKELSGDNLEVIEHGGVAIDIPKPNKVIIGCNIKSTNAITIIKHCRKEGIMCSRMKMHEEKYKLIEEKIL